MSNSTTDTFLGLNGRAADYDRARFAVLPIPYEATTSYGTGTRHGPRAIITASQQVELYDEGLGRESWRPGVATLATLEPDARGPEAMHERIFRAARRIVRDEKFLIGLGGEHSITSGLVRAVKARHRNLSVLQIDAHADLREEYQGSAHSHACVMRRIHELRVPFVGVGIRSLSVEEARLVRREKIAHIPARLCRHNSDWIQEVVSRLSPTVFVTIDIDGFDPACAPATGTPEPGGLDWYQVTDLLAAVAAQHTIVAADVTEVSPQPPDTITEFLAARLIYRLIGLVSK
ncbi:MAG: agmatinase [Phycisphaerae bacterium]|nr:agmatinase [Phycisphaerae bacterium]